MADLQRVDELTEPPVGRGVPSAERERGLRREVEGREHLYPWARMADIFALLDDARARLAAAEGALERVEAVATELESRTINGMQDRFARNHAAMIRTALADTISGTVPAHDAGDGRHGWRRTVGSDMPPHNERVWVAYWSGEDWHVDVGWHEGADWWLKSGKWIALDGTLWMPIPPIPWKQWRPAPDAGAAGAREETL